MQLVLSTFSGIGLLDRSFKEAGFCVVSAGDLILGKHHDIRFFKGIKGKIDGVIGGPPCPDFSSLKRDRSVLNESYGFEMLMEFKRIVLECDPSWYLLENVSGVPNIQIDGYSHQRIDINQAWYENVTRLRHIQFGHKENKYLQIERGVTQQDKKYASCALANDSRSFRELCKLQGLEDDFDLPSFNVNGKKRAVGNGVPLCIGRVLAKAVTDLHENNVTHQDGKICSCGCGRFVTVRAQYYDFSCRKRAQRNRNKSVVTEQQQIGA